MLYFNYLLHDFKIKNKVLKYYLAFMVNQNACNNLQIKYFNKNRSYYKFYYWNISYNKFYNLFYIMIFIEYVK